MMKKLFALALALIMVFALAACDDSGSDPEELTSENIKVGVVHIGPLADQGYTYNHHIGALKMVENLGLRDDQLIPKFDVGEELRQSPLQSTSLFRKDVKSSLQQASLTSFK